MLGTILGTGHSLENKADQILAPRELTFTWGRQTINRKINAEYILNEERELAC